MLLTRRGLLWPRAPEVYPGLSIRRRSEWTDADAGQLEPEEVRFLLVHHTASNTEHAEAEVPAILEGIRAVHTGDRGWPDIAYNFLIDRYGRVWEGRAGSLDGPVRGSATGGNQGYSQLVCLIGDFTSTVPTEEAQSSLVRTLAWLADRYGIDTSPATTVEFTSLGSNRWLAGAQVTTTPIAGHRDMSMTACPGDAFYPMLAESIQPGVEALRQPPSTTTEASTPSSTTTTASTSSTTRTVPLTTTTAVPVPTVPASPTALASAKRSDTGIRGGALPLLTVIAGAVVGLIGWRVRRMSRPR